MSVIECYNGCATFDEHLLSCGVCTTGMSQPESYDFTESGMQAQRVDLVFVECFTAVEIDL